VLYGVLDAGLQEGVIRRAPVHWSEIFSLGG
jgi:hypothetical protein